MTQGSPSSAYDVAIVGASAAAVALAAALAARAARLRIAVIDPAPRVGGGGVYRDDLASILLNTQAGEIALVPGDALHFTRWLARRRGTAVEAELGTYAPRPHFGAYLGELFDELRASSGLELHKLEDHVDRIAPDAGGSRLTLRSGGSLRARAVVIAIGPGRPADPYRLDRSEGYIHCPFPARLRLGAISPARRVLVLGSQLTAIDVAIALGELGHAGPIVLASRRGDLPLVKAGSSVRPPDEDLEHFRGHHRRHGRLPLWLLVRSFRRRLAARGVRLRDYLRMGETRDGAAAFRRHVALASARDPAAVIVEPAIVDALAMLSEDDMATFMRIAYPAMMYRHTAIPLGNAHRILGLLDAGQLAVRGGLRDVVRDGAGFTARFSDGATAHADVVVNATGAARSTCGAGARAPLAGLCAAGLVREIATGGARVSPEGRLIAASGQPLAGTYLLGHDSIGTHAFINSLSMIAMLAGQVADGLVAEVAR